MNTPQSVPAIELALNALTAATPKPGEKLHSFVRRCCGFVTGSKERRILFRAIMDTLNELGLKAMDPASRAQLALVALDDEAPDEAAQ